MIPYRPILTAIVLANGNLQIYADLEAQAWIREERERDRTDLDILWDGFEGYWNNSSFWPFDAERANPFVGLTSAPCIAEDMIVEDDGTLVINGRVWWYPNYMIRSFVDDMLETGYTVFEFGFNNDDN